MTVEYNPMIVTHIVLSRVNETLKWNECARFSTPIDASNYCIYQRKRATNPNFQIMFIPVLDIL